MANATNDFKELIDAIDKVQKGTGTIEDKKLVLSARDCKFIDESGHVQETEFYFTLGQWDKMSDTDEE